VIVKLGVRDPGAAASPPRRVRTTDLDAGGSTMSFKLESTAFADGETVPGKHTCDGPDLSPPLAWSGAPAGTKSFALVCDDPDAPRGTWVHWVLYDLPAATSWLPEGLAKDRELSGGGFQGANDFRRIGYGGPCPPPGRPHRYFFRLYALDATLGLPAGATKNDVLKASEGHTLAEAQLMGRYGR
jgi:Raf kinase inhibitor-like YbhB/YbcL family protein